ncbi:MAG: carbon-nitrogen hydrolase family protein [Planctomycetes bacterium]|nr:carbon-nitrogen hydrolase family protein [Planctomycetota bacterium]
MRIALAQSRPARGAVALNLEHHVMLAERAVGLGADLVVFPELSLTGYEPELARALALEPDDPVLDPLQRLADSRGVVIAPGAPLRSEGQPRIGLVLLRPHAPRRAHAKHHLHADEEPYFGRGQEPVGLVDGAPRIGLAICYELSVPEHAAATFASGAQIYLASAAKTAPGVAQAHLRLAEVARAFHAPVLFVNAVGPSADGLCAGGSAAWDAEGRLLGRLDDAHEGLLTFDSVSGRLAAASGEEAQDVCA